MTNNGGIFSGGFVPPPPPKRRKSSGMSWGKQYESEQESSGAIPLHKPGELTMFEPPFGGGIAITEEYTDPTMPPEEEEKLFEQEEISPEEFLDAEFSEVGEDIGMEGDVEDISTTALDLWEPLGVGGGAEDYVGDDDEEFPPFGAGGFGGSFEAERGATDKAASDEPGWWARHRAEKEKYYQEAWNASKSKDTPDWDNLSDKRKKEFRSYYDAYKKKTGKAISTAEKLSSTKQSAALAKLKRDRAAARYARMKTHGKMAGGIAGALYKVGTMGGPIKRTRMDLYTTGKGKDFYTSPGMRKLTVPSGGAAAATDMKKLHAPGALRRAGVSTDMRGLVGGSSTGMQELLVPRQSGRIELGGMRRITQPSTGRLRTAGANMPIGKTVLPSVGLARRPLTGPKGEVASGRLKSLLQQVSPIAAAARKTPQLRL